MAVFGVPRAHEDDAFRAAVAAFEIRDAPSAAVRSTRARDPRVGIATGEVLASGSGAGVTCRCRRPRDRGGGAHGRRGGRGDPHRRGDRDGSFAGRPGLSPSRRRPGPPGAFSTLTRGRPAVGSLKAPLVGREPELGRLREAFAARHAATAHTAPVHDPRDGGDRQVAARAGVRHAGRRTGDGRRRPLRAVRGGHHLLVATRDRRSARGRPVEPARRRTRGAARSPRASGGDRRRGRRRSVRRSSGRREASSRRSPATRPLVVFFEDVHWAEPTFLDLVEYLAERTHGCADPPRLHRPPRAPRAAIRLERARRPNADSLGSSRLPDRDCEALIGNLGQRLGTGDDGPGARDRRGQPAVHRAARRDARRRRTHEAELAIPPTIDALLSARLDRLGPGERAVISRAAIVGKEFSAEATSICCPRTPARSAPATWRPWPARSSSRPRPQIRSRARPSLPSHPHPAGRIPGDPQEPACGASRALRRLGRGRRSATESPSSRRSSATTSSRRFATVPSSAAVGEQELELAHRAVDHLASAGQRAFQRGDMPATVNLLGRAAALPTPRGGAGLAALPELGYALFEIGEVDEASAVLAGARERARADGDRRVEWRVAITRPRIEMYGNPAGIDLDALATETETAIEVLGELGDEAGPGARVHGSLRPPLEQGKASARRARRRRRRRSYARRAGNRREVGWALGQIALCAIHGPMPVAEGLRWLERSARSGAGEPDARRESLGVRRPCWRR